MYKIKFEKGNELKCYKHILNYLIKNKIYRFLVGFFANLIAFHIIIALNTKIPQVILLCIFIFNCFLTMLFLTYNIYINITLRKAVNNISDFSRSTFIANVKVEKVIQRKFLPYYLKYSENYLKICYVRDEENKIKKYYYILTKPDDFKTPSCSGTYNIHFYNNSNIIKKFETWISPKIL